MTQHLDLDSLSDFRDAVSVAVSKLETGGIVAVPDDVGTLLLALPEHLEAVQRLEQLSVEMSEGQKVVSLPHKEVVADYCDVSCELCEKLYRRCWPGPVALRVGNASPQGLSNDWAETARDWALSATGRCFCVPGNEFANQLLRHLSSPGLGLVIQETSHQYNFTGHVDLCVHSESDRYEGGVTVVQVGAGRYEIERSGIVSSRMLARLAGDAYLFVCTGNTCRSPMAEGLFRRMLAERFHCSEDELLDRGYVVVSAGLAAYPGAPASREAVELLKAEGIDISSHESQPVSEELLFHCDHILTMTRNHRDAILQSFPELAGRVRLLSNSGKDVSDPIGGGPEEYRRCRDEIDGYLRALFDSTGTGELRSGDSDH